MAAAISTNSLSPCSGTGEQPMSASLTLMWAMRCAGSWLFMVNLLAVLRPIPLRITLPYFGCLAKHFLRIRG